MREQRRVSPNETPDAIQSDGLRLTSDATVLLRCRVLPTTGKGAAKVDDVGTYHMPFQLTAQY